jgi:preprotein translocase subunit SecA
MEHLRDSVRLRAYGQRDPLVEYKSEAHKLFEQFLASFQTNAMNMIFKLAPAGPAESGIRSQESGIMNRLPVNDGGNIGRNDPCPCGAINPATGEVYKYKKCGLINAPHHRA